MTPSFLGGRVACTRTLAGAVALALLAPSLTAQQVEEYRLKAALVYNLARFVDWPDGIFPTPNAPLIVCVLGRDPFGADLDEALKGRTIKGRLAIAKRVVDVTPGCQVLFVANSEARRLPAIIERVRDTNVLTIGETSDFIEQGGMIRLVVAEDERVRFEVNLSAAERAHVRISARVMALAASVKRSSEHKP